MAQVSTWNIQVIKHEVSACFHDYYQITALSQNQTAKLLHFPQTGPDFKSLAQRAILVDKTTAIDVSYQKSFHRRVGFWFSDHQRNAIPVPPITFQVDRNMLMSSRYTTTGRLVFHQLTRGLVDYRREFVEFSFTECVQNS